MIHRGKDFSIVDETEVNVFLEFPCFFYDPADVGSVICGSSAFSKSILNSWKLLVHVLLKPSVENFEHFFASESDESYCAVVEAFFGILITASCTMLQASIHSSWGTLFIKSNPLNLFVNSTV